MKRILFITACVCSVIALAATAASLKVASLPEKGEYTAPGVGLAKPLYVEAFGLLPTNGTLIIKRVVESSTNTVYSGSASGGAVSAAVTTTNYFAAGDSLVREGTCTNGVVRLIFEGD